MADQKVSNERKKELEQLDPFQENLLKVMGSVKEYKKQLILIVSAIVLVVVVFSGIMYSFQKAENSAASIVSQASLKYAKINDPDKGYLETKNDFQTIFTEYSNTNSGKLAKVQFAKICYEAGKFDESFTCYKQALDIFKNDALMENFLLSALGHVCLAKKEVEKAKKYFSQIENGASDLLKDEARYALAMLYESSGNRVESRKMFEKIVSDYDRSIYTPVAQSKLDEMK